ncbi:MAG: 5-dehydro-4-deoxy-D-glucuronate isomerase [Anaerolineae bacterium]|nr:5-dehydro-4-deoxy-D-glucuronate isomerase [Anaerolineae bacterium]
MQMRYPSNPEKVKTFTTDQLRAEFLIDKLFSDDAITLVYSHIDRIIVGGACPVTQALELTASKKDLGTDTFLERRELGVVNVGGAGTVTVDGADYAMSRLDGLYVGKGARSVRFASADSAAPAHFYFTSTPAHTSYPTTHIPISSAEPNHLGSVANSNERTIYKYIHPDGVKSCQLVLGVTLLEPNNMWNTMPAHTHARRMEVYFYFDIAGENVVFHLMGEPGETRHLVMRNEQAVISPSWSIHAGMGTGNYAFIWAMAGENQTFSDMDAVAMTTLR